MAQIIQYQPSVQPNSAIANSSSSGAGLRQFGQDLNEGLQSGLYGLRQLAHQQQVVRDNTYEAVATEVAATIKGSGHQKLKDEYANSVKNRAWADFDVRMDPKIQDHYSDTTLDEHIAPKFDGNVPPAMRLLVRKKLGYAKEELIEETRLHAVKLNVEGADISSEERRQAFTKTTMTGTNEDVVKHLLALRDHYDERVNNMTLDASKVPALLGDAAHTALRTRMALGLESGSPLAYENHKALLKEVLPFLTGDTARAEVAALKGDKVAFQEEQKNKVREIAVTAGHVFPPEMANDVAAMVGLPVHAVQEIVTEENHKALESIKKANERAEYGKIKNSERTLDDLTSRYLDAFSGEQKTLHLRLNAADTLLKAAKDGMTGEDRLKLETRIQKMKADAANVQTDIATYSKLKMSALMNPHSNKVVDSIIYAPNVGFAEKKELQNTIFELRKQFIDETKRKNFELATKTYELKSGMFSEFPETIAADAQVEVMRVLSEVVLKGETTDIPYIKSQWVKYQTNPTEFIDALMVQQKKVATKLTVQRGKEVYDGLRYKPDSPAAAREISKATFDTSTDEGKNAVKALQMFMNKTFPNAVQQQSILQDEQDAKALKDAAKQFERKK